MVSPEHIASEEVSASERDPAVAEYVDHHLDGAPETVRALAESAAELPPEDLDQLADFIEQLKRDRAEQGGVIESDAGDSEPVESPSEPTAEALEEQSESVAGLTQQIRDYAGDRQGLVDLVRRLGEANLENPGYIDGTAAGSISAERAATAIERGFGMNVSMPEAQAAAIRVYEAEARGQSVEAPEAELPPEPVEATPESAGDAPEMSEAADATEVEPDFAGSMEVVNTLLSERYEDSAAREKISENLRTAEEKIERVALNLDGHYTPDMQLESQRALGWTPNHPEVAKTLQATAQRVVETTIPALEKEKGGMTEYYFLKDMCALKELAPAEYDRILATPEGSVALEMVRTGLEASVSEEKAEKLRPGEDTRYVVRHQQQYRQLFSQELPMAPGFVESEAKRLDRLRSSYLSDDLEANWQSFVGFGGGSNPPAEKLVKLLEDFGSEIAENPAMRQKVQNLFDRTAERWFFDDGKVAVNNFDSRYKTFKQALALFDTL